MKRPVHLLSMSILQHTTAKQQITLQISQIKLTRVDKRCDE
jgi:hypothetical protein